MRRLLFSIVLPVLFVPAAHAADMRAAIAPSPDYQGEGTEFIVSWTSLAGKLYNVEAATDLGGNWSILNPGPIVAESGQAAYRDQTASPVMFYRVRKLDTEPPDVVHLNPADGAIAVGREEPLTVELWDEAGIAWESIAFSVASGASIGIGDPRLAFSDNVLMYVPGSGEYYGDYGETVAVTLSVSDKLGYRLENYTWTFRLELETVLASNVVLIDEVSGLTLLSIEGDTYTFSYTGDGPGFSLGDILVSTDPDNPYKRRVLDIANHPESYTVDILTEAVPLADLFEQGSIRMRQLVVEEPATAPLSGRGPQALFLEPGKEYRKYFSGTVIDGDGISVKVTSGYVEFVPEVTVASDFNGLRLTSFDCQVTGTVNLKAVVKATATFAGSYDPEPVRIYHLRRIPVQIVCGFPVWEEIVLEFWVGFTAQTELEGWVEAGFESSSSLSIGARLRDGEWTKYITPKHDFEPIYPDWQIDGNVTLQAYVEPRLVVYLESIAGPFLNIKPYLQLDGTFQLNPWKYDWALYAGITGELGIVVRGWDDDWGELPSWELVLVEPMLLDEKSYPRGWEGPTRWYVDDSVSSSGDGSSWGTAFRTIQEGIDAASHGHTVVVAQGTYLENIHFRGKNILLTSIDCLNSTVVSKTTIDGGKSGSVVTFDGSEDATCVLSGFVIQNGRSSVGAGVNGHRTHATIRNSIVTGNYATQWGAGLFACHGNIRNNIICRNVAGIDGPGISDCDGLVENNTVCHNLAMYIPAGIEFCFGTIRNCIIWGNKDWGGSTARQLSQSAVPTYSCIQDWTGGGIGNTSLDPRFVDPDGADNDPETFEDNDYRLRSGSPCIDAGTNASWMWNAVDPDGNPRIINGRVDIGAYEYKP